MTKLLEQSGKNTIIRCWSSSEGDVCNRQSSKNKRTRVDTRAKKEKKRWKRWEKTNK